MSQVVGINIYLFRQQKQVRREDRLADNGLTFVYLQIIVIINILDRVVRLRWQIYCTW